MKHGDKILVATEFLFSSIDYMPHSYLTYIDCRNKIVKASQDGTEYFIPQEHVILKKELYSEIF